MPKHENLNKIKAVINTKLHPRKVSPKTNSNNFPNPESHTSFGNTQLCILKSKFELSYLLMFSLSLSKTKTCI